MNMRPIIFFLPHHADLGDNIAKQNDYEIGKVTTHQFPDAETYLQINTPVKNRSVIIITSLDKPNEKLLPLLFLAEAIKDFGAKNIGLVAPYLAYMRQDKQFNPGEAVTSKYFAALLSKYFNWLVTIDPHLHRYHSLNEIYTIPTLVLHAADPISQWIKKQIINPVIIGPDKESQQWVADIAKKINATFMILEKIRKGDRSVEVSIPQIEIYKNHTPVLIDDIISTAQTMIETTKQLKNAKLRAPICIGVHGIFSGNAYKDLINAGAEKVVTCNTILHSSNAIDLTQIVAEALEKII